jgi:hypothetical protein
VGLTTAFSPAHPKILTPKTATINKIKALFSIAPSFILFALLQTENDPVYPP